MTRPSDMTDEELVRAVRSINDTLTVRPLSARARRTLDAFRERLIDHLSMHDEERDALEEERRIDAYMDEARS